MRFLSISESFCEVLSGAGAGAGVCLVSQLANVNQVRVNKINVFFIK
jgi:hypothetical protein